MHAAFPTLRSSVDGTSYSKAPEFMAGISISMLHGYSSPTLDLPHCVSIPPPIVSLPLTIVFLMRRQMLSSWSVFFTDKE